MKELERRIKENLKAKNVEIVNYNLTLAYIYMLYLKETLLVIDF